MMTVQESTQSAQRAAARTGLRFGYNHNFRHQGRLFHVQTEDSGSPHCHIHSHIFFAGTVIASRKTEYGQANRQSHRAVEALMRQSHREMCVTLRDGAYDEQIAALTSRPTVTRRRRTEREMPAIGAAAEPLPAAFHDETPAQLAATRTCLSTLQSGVTGFLGAALVNRKTGTTVRALSNTVDMKVAVSGNTQVLQTKMRLLEQLSLEGTLEDILISLDRCFCIIRPLNDAFFLYVILDRAQANLAMARRVVSIASAEFTT